MSVNLRQLFSTLQLVKRATGNDKLALLNKLFSNAKVGNSEYVVYETMKFLVDKTIVTQLSTKKLNKLVDRQPTQVITTYDEYLKYLQSGTITGKDSDVANVQHYVTTGKDVPDSDEIRQFLLELASKKYKSGMQSTIFNKSAQACGLDGVIKFAVQTGVTLSKLSQKELDNLGEFVLTEKLDGIRCIAIIGSTGIELRSRNGRLIENAYEIEQALYARRLPSGTVLDGELLAINASEKAEDTFRTTASIANSQGEKVGLCYNVFDITTLENFKSGLDVTPYNERRNKLDIIPADEYVKVIPKLYQGASLDYAHDLLEKVIEQGCEGLMLNPVDSPYKTKRVKTLVKLKQVNEADGRVVGTFEGQGEFKGLLGGIIVTYKDTTVRVGSGFDLATRRQYAQNPDELIGQIATYKYTTPSENAKNEQSVRFPRFKAFRTDKNTTNYDV